MPSISQHWVPVDRILACSYHVGDTGAASFGLNRNDFGKRRCFADQPTGKVIRGSADLLDLRNSYVTLRWLRMPKTAIRAAQ